MLDNIASFIDLCEIKSFKICAEKLKIQPSTLSKHISELENELGKQLIIRTSKMFELTDFGIYMYNKCKHIPLFIENTINVYEKKVPQENKCGTLNIALGAVISYNLVCKHLHKFIDEYPNIKLNLNFYPNIQSWPSPQIDIILTPHNIKGTNLTNRFVRHEYIKLYCNSSYAITHGIPKTTEELYDHNIIGMINQDYSPIEYYKLKYINTNEECIVNLKDNFLNINNALHIRQIGLNSDCIFGCYESIIRDDLNVGLVVPILPDWIAYEFDYYLVTKNNISVEAQLFVNFLYECMKN